MDEPGPEANVADDVLEDDVVDDVPADDSLVDDSLVDDTDADGEEDLARAALAGARANVRRPKAHRRFDAEQRRRTRRDNLVGRSAAAARIARNAGGYSGPGEDPAHDPQPVGRLLGDTVDELGWEQSLAHARIFADWAALVGGDVAAHCAPQSLRDGELRITAESTAWATQLRMLAGTLLARLVAETGDARLVTKLVITGPTAPSWKHGGWSVPGARGPRDTYG